MISTQLLAELQRRVPPPVRLGDAELVRLKGRRVAREAPRVAAAVRGGPRRRGLERVAALGPVGVVVVFKRVELLRDGAVGALRGGEAQQAPHEDRLT